MGNRKMARSTQRLISALFGLVSVVVFLMFGIIAPATMIENTVDALNGEGPALVFMFIGAAAFTLSFVFLILLNRLRLAIIHQFGGGTQAPDAPDKPARIYKVVGEPGRVERFLLKALIGLSVVLCITGYGQYSTVTIEDLYVQLTYLHTAFGLLTFLLLMPYLFVLSRRHYGLKLQLLITLYPLIFVIILQSPGPLLATFIAMNIVILPLGIFLLARNETPGQRRPALIVAGIALFGFVLVTMTGSFPVVDPINLRFSFRHRNLHAYLSPIAVLLPLYFYWISRKGRDLPTIATTRLLYACGLLIFAGSVAGASMHWVKEFRLEDLRQKSQIRSAPLVSETGDDPGTLQPGVLSDDTFCGTCHPIPMRQWARSMHANAARTVTFQAVLTSLVQQHGPQIALDCAACHDPEVALLKRPELLTDPDHLARSQGVSCRTCHYMNLTGEKNAQYGLQIPRSDFFPGTLEERRLRILVGVQEHINDVTKPITRDGKQCSACHSLRATRKGHEMIPLDNVTSFEKSSFGPKVRCQRCHMPHIVKDKHSYSWMDHSFFGIQQELSQIVIGQTPEMLDEIRLFEEDTGRFLAGELPVLNLMEATMDETFKSYRFTDYKYRLLSVLESIKVATYGSHFYMSIGRAQRKGDSLDLVLTTLNINAGHDFPSSLFANINNVWFELAVTDAAGAEVFRSGFEQDDLTHRLGRIEIDGNGQAIQPRDSLKYETIINKKFLEPDKEYEVAWSVPLGPEVKFPLTLTYKLQYHRYNDDFAKSFSTPEKAWSFPIRTISTETFTIESCSREAPGDCTLTPRPDFDEKQ
jgi:hypothetical protein